MSEALAAARNLRELIESEANLVEAGITDFRAALRIPRDPDAATDYLSQLVRAFRKAVGR